MSWISDPNIWMALLTLSALEIVLGIDNIIFIAILSGKLPPNQQAKARNTGLMVAAIIIAVIVMILLAGRISAFVENHPTIKILALSFLLLIGVSLIGEGLDLHIPKGYIYFAMAFSAFVEVLNMRIRKRKPDPIKLRNPRSAKLASGRHDGVFH